MKCLDVPAGIDQSYMMICLDKFPRTLKSIKRNINPFGPMSRYKRHQNKVKGLGRNSSYLAGFFFFFFENVQSVG